MADITRLARFLNGRVRGIDLTSNTPVVSSIKIGAGQTELTQTILDNLVSLQDGSEVAGTLHTHDDIYYTETELDAGQLDTRYYTETELDAGQLDTRYYTETELDAGQLDNRYFTETELGGTGTGAGASLIGVEDANTRYTATDVEAALDEVKEIADNLVTLSGVAANATDLGTFTGSVIPDSSAMKAALQSLETYAENTRSIIEQLEFQDSALDYVTDNTVVPATEVSGDRYILSDDGGAPNAAWDGASAGDIVEFDGTSWQATTPTTGMFISADDEPDVLYYWGGASWETKNFESTTASTGLTKVGFDIQLADAALADGIQVSSGAISVGLGTDSGLTFSSGGLVVDFATSGVKAVSADNLASTSNGLGASLIGIEDAGGDFTATDVEGALAELKADLAAQDDASEITYTPSTLADWSGAADPGNVDGGLDQLADRVTTLEATPSSVVREDIDLGETSLAADTLRAVRFAKGGETAGRVYFADNDASSTFNGEVVGLTINGALVNAGSATSVTKLGPVTVTSHGFTVGATLYLGASGVVTETAPTAADTAVVQVGYARDANTIEVKPQEIGIN